MKRFFYCLAAIFCGFSFLCQAQNTDSQRLVDSLAQTDPLVNGNWGVFAVRGEIDTLVSFNKSCIFLPASNNKLITTGLSLFSLGPDWRYQTSFGSNSTVSKSELNGDLYIIGEGDPTIGAGYKGTPSLEETFNKWKAVLDSAGIKKINGRIIGDARWFDGDPISDSWSYGDIETNYSAVSGALNIFKNKIILRINNRTQEGQRINDVISEAPFLPWLIPGSVATTSKGGADNLYCVSSDIIPVCEIRGSLGLKRKSVRLTATNHFPAYTCAQQFEIYLIEHGIEVSGGYADVSPVGTIRTNLNDPYRGSRAASKLNILGRAESVPLKQMITDCNFNSDNFYAETFLRTLSKSVTGSACLDSCTVARSALLRQMGVRHDDIRLKDGSGLSFENFCSPEFIVTFLTAMSETKVFPDFVETLPSPGKGTVRSLLKTQPQALKDRIHIKSGSLTGVKCYSGYILAEDGDPRKNIIFSILTNNITTHTTKLAEAIDKIITTIANEE